MDKIPKVALVFSHDQKDGVCTIEELDLPPEERRHSSCGYLLGPYEMVRHQQTYDAYKLAFVYPTNPGYKLLAFTLGYHRYDTECLIFLVSRTTGRTEWVFFSAHSTAEGHWRTLDQCMFDLNGHLLAYVSPTSHAMYPEPGRYYRMFGFANDKTSMHGWTWYVPRIVTVAEGYDARSNYNRTIRPPEQTLSVFDRFFALGFLKKQVNKYWN